MEYKKETSHPNYMESYSSSSQLFSVIGIFITSIKNLHRNKPLILSITFFTVSLTTIANLAYFFFQLLFTDLFTNLFLTISSLDTNFLKSFQRIEKDFTLLLGLQLIFALALFVISWVSTVAMVYVSAMCHLHKNLTLKELLLVLKKIWKRPLITFFYVYLLNVGYAVLLFLLLVLSFLQLAEGSKLISLVFVGAFVVIIASLFLVYLTVVYMLGLVVSVLEDASGFQALGRAEKLIKGRKVEGFDIGLVFVIFLSVPFIASMTSSPQKSGIVAVVIMVVQTIICGLVRMFSLMVYTVFYFECKKSHGEEVEVEGEMGYSMVSTIPLVDPALP